MKSTRLIKLAQFLLICFVVISCVSSYIIWDEKLSSDELKLRVKRFNEWFAEINPESKIEARLMDDNSVKVFALEDIKFDQAYFSLNKNFSLTSDMIYESRLGQFVNDLESKFGYDEYTNLALFLLNEIGNKDSIFKPYLDILPREPTSIAFKYWDYNLIEKELPNMPIIRRIVDYKILIEKKARIFEMNLFNKNPELFNSEIFNKENMEWIFLTIDTRLKLVENSLRIVPMLDFLLIGENPQNPTKIQKISLYDSQILKAVAIADFSKGDMIYDNLGLSNDILMVYHGTVLENNSFDCYNLQLTFTERREDNLILKRKDFFQKFFMFDKNHIDLIREECISLKNPYSRRVLFYFYTCLMEENDLEKTDPKRTNLEEDKLILEYAKERLTSIYDLSDSKLEEDEENLKQETNTKLKLAISYKIEQKKYLLKLIELYNNELFRLLKEDIL